MFHFSQHSSYNLKDIWVSCCIIFSCISCTCKNWCPFKLKSSGTEKHLLEKIRVVGWLRIQEMNRQCHVCESSVMVKKPAVFLPEFQSFLLHCFKQMLLKQSGIPLDSLLDFYEQNHNETKTLTLEENFEDGFHIQSALFLAMRLIQSSIEDGFKRF